MSFFRTLDIWGKCIRFVVETNYYLMPIEKREVIKMNRTGKQTINASHLLSQDFSALIELDKKLCKSRDESIIISMAIGKRQKNIYNQQTNTELLPSDQMVFELR